jgi:uncharacterized protein (DUF362 family)
LGLFGLYSVSFVKAEDSSLDGIRAAIRKSISLLDFSSKKKVDKIVIKPNMCYYYHPSTGEITDPRFVGAIIDVLREIFPSNPEVSIVESDASAMKCCHIFKMLRYDELAREKAVRLVNLCEEKSKQVEIEVSGHTFKFDIPELLLDGSFLVNLPKIKYMHGVKLTCGLKNIFGCNAVQRKSIYHSALSEAIVGLNKIMLTSLVVADGLVVNGKYTKRLNLVMSSENVVAADTAASRMLGLNPMSVKQLSLASREGLGELDFAPVGDYDYFKHNFPKKGLKDNLFEIGASAYLRAFHRY